MGDTPGTLELAGRHLTLALRPLVVGLSDLAHFKQLMYRLGWRVTALPPEYSSLAAAVETAVTKLEALSDHPSPNDIAGLLQAVKGAYAAIQGITTAPPGVDAAAFLAEIGERLLELLLTDYLALKLPKLYSLLLMLNVIQLEHQAATSGRPSIKRVHFNWSQIPNIVSNPQEIPKLVYGWGTADLNVQRIVDHLSEFFFAIGLPVIIQAPDKALAVEYADLVDEPIFGLAKSLVAPFHFAIIGNKPLQAAFALRELPAAGGKLPGLVLEPQIPTEFPLTFKLTKTVNLRLLAGTNAASLFGILIRPDGISIRYPFAPGTVPPKAGIGIGFDSKPATPTVLVGDRDATRLELQGASVDLAASSKDGKFELVLGAELTGLTLVLNAGEGDSFIQSVIGDGENRIDIPLGVEWSSRFGVRFKGASTFEMTLHPHLHLGPIAVNDASIKLSAPTGGPSRIRLEVGVGIAGSLGPLKFLVENVGIQADAVFAPGNAGPFGISLGFKHPDGAGLEINTGGFTGGGFLIRDADKGEYSGGLELMFLDTILVRGLAVLDTKSSDGEDFSLLVLITSDFPPIQLPYDFTLEGIGGLLGLNRSALIETLASGLRDGTLDSILFPTDVIANAGRILADLKRVFPRQDGHFLVAPMAEIGWGTPTIIKVKLGLVLDVPRPVVALVGVLRAVLPADDVPLLVLKVPFVGTVDFHSGQLRFDATLYESRVLNFTLTGDMAVRAYWKDNANFLLTVGGFNPAYTPPPMDLGKLERLSIILFEGNPDVRAEGYFAVTANTVQFGARVELRYGVHGVEVYGFLSLDAVIHPLSFHFVADTAAMLAVRAGSHVLFSIHLNLTLEGPAPWHAHGTASFEIGFVFTITIHVNFDITVGDPEAILVPVADVLAKLADALANPGNWSARLPPQGSQSVRLRALPDSGQELILHPFGFLEVSQKVVPLGMPIQRFGSSAPQNGNLFEIADVKAGDASIATVREEFAPAQFFDMSDAEELSRPSFDRYGAGVAIGADAAPLSDFMRAREVAYKVIYAPEHHPVRVRYPMPDLLSQFVLAGAAPARSPLSAATKSPSALTERVAFAAEQFIIVSADNLEPHAPGVTFASAAAADAAVRRLVGERPELFGAVQVMPAGLTRASA